MHLVLKSKDGFQKEEEREYDNNRAPLTYITRQWARLDNPFIYQPPSSENLHTFDREFLLKCQFYALGKQIAYYEEI